MRRAQRRGIAHALIGASALAARGVARSTYDIDLLTTDGQVLEPGLWQSLSSDGLHVDIRRGVAMRTIHGAASSGSRHQASGRLT